MVLSSFLFLLAMFCMPLVAGVILMIMSRRRGPGYPACGACMYDVTGTAGRSTRCPECGADLLAVGIVPPSAHRRNPVFWIGLALAISPLFCGGVLSVTSVAAQRRMMEARRAAQIRAAQQQQQQASVAATQMSAGMPPQSRPATQPGAASSPSSENDR